MRVAKLQYIYYSKDMYRFALGGAERKEKKKWANVCKRESIEIPRWVHDYCAMELD